MKTIIINLTTPASWPSDAPPYYSREGWELEKKIAYERVKQELQAFGQINNC
jgi:hypothetical protein